LAKLFLEKVEKIFQYVAVFCHFESGNRTQCSLWGTSFIINEKRCAISHENLNFLEKPKTDIHVNNGRIFLKDLRRYCRLVCGLCV